MHHALQTLEFWYSNKTYEVVIYRNKHQIVNLYSVDPLIYPVILFSTGIFIFFFFSCLKICFIAVHNMFIHNMFSHICKMFHYPFFFFFLRNLNFSFVISFYKTPSGILVISKGSPVLSYFVILPIYSYVHHTHIHIHSLTVWSLSYRKK